MKSTFLNFLTFIAAILFCTQLNAQFAWNSWVAGNTSGTITTGTCNANVSITQSDPTQFFTNSSPSYQNSSTWGNGNGLFLSHNWTGINKSTIVTINFTTAVVNPCFTIDDINTRPTCYRGCSNNWSDEVQVSATRTSGSGVITVTSNSTASSVPISNIYTVALSGSNTVATVSAKPNCYAASGNHYDATFCLSGTFTQIVITYRSGPWFSRSVALSALTDDCGATTSTCQSQLTTNCSVTDGDPDNQHIKIGPITTTNCFAAMPVEFGDFYYQCNDNALNLNWYTESELNNDKFQILASKDGLNFDLINEIAGAGTTQSLKNYNVKITNRDFETKYYKLRQIDYDGKMVDLKTIHVPLQCEDQSKSFSVFPNPTQHELNILNFGKENQVHIKVTNIEGKIIHQDEIESDLDILKINTSNWSKGMYFIEISNNEINETYKIEKI